MLPCCTGNWSEREAAAGMTSAAVALECAVLLAEEIASGVVVDDAGPVGTVGDLVAGTVGTAGCAMAPVAFTEGVCKVFR